MGNDTLVERAVNLQTNYLELRGYVYLLELAFSDASFKDGSVDLVKCDALESLVS